MPERRAAYRLPGQRARAAYLASESEESFLANILEQAKLYGWLAFHPRPARTEKGWRTLTQGDKGWPDLVLCKAPRFLVVELKTERGTLSKEQEAWLQDLRGAGVDARIWRPSMIEEITAVLRGDGL